MAKPGDTDDLASLAKLDEDVLMNELKVRYNGDKIYTYVGDIVVAVNPFQDLGIYTKQFSEHYNMVKRSEHPPHIFAVSDMAYQAMLGVHTSAPKNQCILISGESGAGKTESTKLIIKQLIELSHGHTQLEQQIIQVNPLLEAFGNAQTVMNDNSSRFGRYIMLRFQNGSVKGSKISEYLLEKSRVVHQGTSEQNFHVFYYMFAGCPPEKQKKLQLENPSAYRYFSDGASCLKNGSTTTALKERYEELENAMDIVGFTTEEQDDLFTILAAVLNMGNINIEEKDDYASISTKGALQKAVTLLGLKPDDLKHCLTCSVTFTRGEEVRKNYSKAEAEDCRDAVAKAVYGRLFSWIVNKVNSLLAPLELLHPTDTQEIGILDIFGFEHFEHNSFEQACINLANEQLQAFFNRHIFQLEQEEYMREGVDWTEIQWKDNQPVLELFLAKPIGLLALLDEESLFPRGTDHTFVDKLNMKFDDNYHFEKSNHARSTSFTIKHYAGPVKYKAKGWLVKNRDTLPPGVMNLLRESKNELLGLIFKGQISRTGTLALQSRTKRKSTQRKALHDARETMQRRMTVGAQFRNSLNILLERMNSSQPIFVRCIKPNTLKKAGVFDDEYVKRQLLYTGMLETIRIRRDGYAIRPTFKEFVQKYELLLNQFGAKASQENCHAILSRYKLDGWKVGKTKVFLRHAHLEILSDALDVYVKKVLHMQRLVRGYLGRCRARRQRQLAEKEKKITADLLACIERLNVTLLKNLNDKVKEDAKIEKEKLKQLAKEKAKPHALPRLKKKSVIAAATQAEAPAPVKTMTDSGSDPIQELHSSGSESEILEDEFERVQPKKMVSEGTETDFLKPGTRAASIRWFRETQLPDLRENSGQFAEWFHGIIKRRDAEYLLRDKPVGCFLIRVGESRFGYTLSFCSEEKIRHYMIDLTRSNKYVVGGEPKAHRNLNELVRYYQTHSLSNWSGVLRVACGQVTGHCDYAELVDDADLYCDIETARPYDSGSSTCPTSSQSDVHKQGVNGTHGGSYLRPAIGNDGYLDVAASPVTTSNHATTLTPQPLDPSNRASVDIPPPLPPSNQSGTSTPSPVPSSEPTGSATPPPLPPSNRTGGDEKSFVLSKPLPALPKPPARNETKMGAHQKLTQRLTIYPPATPPRLTKTDVPPPHSSSNNRPNLSMSHEGYQGTNSDQGASGNAQYSSTLPSPDPTREEMQAAYQRLIEAQEFTSTGDGDYLEMTDGNGSQPYYQTMI